MLIIYIPNKSEIHKLENDYNTHLTLAKKKPREVSAIMLIS